MAFLSKFRPIVRRLIEDDEPYKRHLAAVLPARLLLIVVHTLGVFAGGVAKNNNVSLIQLLDDMQIFQFRHR